MTIKMLSSLARCLACLARTCRLWPLFSAHVCPTAETVLAPAERDELAAIALEIRQALVLQQAVSDTSETAKDSTKRECLARCPVSCKVCRKQNYGPQGLLHAELVKIRQEAKRLRSLNMMDLVNETGYHDVEFFLRQPGWPCITDLPEYDRSADLYHDAESGGQSELAEAACWDATHRRTNLEARTTAFNRYILENASQL